MKAVVIAAPQSGAGKTTVTLGIMAALARQGLAIAPFKTGPDFIDPGYHRLVTGRPSVNLDGWICPENFIRETFAHHTAATDVAVIEGAMGLFDGIGATSAAGSTAQIAALLHVPVVLVVDGKGQAGSVAALLQGFSRFAPAVRVAGVIFNNVAGDRHAALLREAVAHACPEVAVLGSIPRDERLRIPSRHLGLVTAEDNPLTEEFIKHLVGVVERQVDLQGFLQLDTALRVPPPPSGAGRGVGSVRIAVARDAAFCFAYEDNLRLLRDAGAEIVPFSPLTDREVPAGTAGIYLPGGYPELFAPRLAANGTMIGAVRAAIEAGMPVYAECGGFIYLTRGVTPPGEAETTGELVGAFPATTRMLPKRKALGYREVEVSADSIIGPGGTVARGHEFHYSEMEEMPAEIERLYKVRREGVDLGREGFRRHNCLASYVHLHFGSNPGLAPALVAACRTFHESRA